MKTAIIIFVVLLLLVGGFLLWKNRDKLFPKNSQSNTGNNNSSNTTPLDPCETCMQQYKDLGYDYDQQLFICHGNGNCT